MTMIVETGAGIVNANSYVSLVSASAYHTLYGNTDWSGADSDLEQALIMGTRSIELLYGPKFISYKLTTSAGPLLFPQYIFYDNRNIVVTSGTIPQCLKDAVCEAALMYLNGTDIFPLQNVEGNIRVNKVKVGEIEVENQYVGKAGEAETYTSFRKIDLILQPIIRQAQTSVNIRR